MCLAVPMKLLSVSGDKGVAEVAGVRRTVRLDLVPGTVQGQYVVVHAGYAIQVMDEAAAAETLDLITAAVGEPRP